MDNKEFSSDSGVLIPSLSGHIFKFGNLKVMVLESSVLIPSLSGHIFKFMISNIFHY